MRLRDRALRVEAPCETGWCCSNRANSAFPVSGKYRLTYEIRSLPALLEDHGTKYHGLEDDEH